MKIIAFRRFRAVRVVVVLVVGLVLGFARPLAGGTLVISRGGHEGSTLGAQRPFATRISDPWAAMPVRTIASPPFDVTEETVSFVDPTRSTPPRGVVPGHTGRELFTYILRPSGVSGPLPLVVFAHGWNSDPDIYMPLLEAWASAGFMVAAPVLPDSADTLPGSPVSNYPAQAADLSFLITQLLEGGYGVDPNRIAVAGHSDGGTDVALLALNPAYADHRIRAYLSLSGEIPPGLSGPWGVPTPGALMVMVGTDDQYGLAPASAQVFSVAEMTKAMITVRGGDHLQMYVSTSPLSVEARQETTCFLEAALTPGTVVPQNLAAALQASGAPPLALSVS